MCMRACVCVLILVYIGNGMVCILLRIIIEKSFVSLRQWMQRFNSTISFHLNHKKSSNNSNSNSKMEITNERLDARVCMKPVAIAATAAAATKCLKDQNQTGKSVDKFRTFLFCLFSYFFFSFDGWNGRAWRTDGVQCNKMLHAHTAHTQITVDTKR